VANRICANWNMRIHLVPIRNRRSCCRRKRHSLTGPVRASGQGSSLPQVALRVRLRSQSRTLSSPRWSSIQLAVYA
jgi:hypothetical protein